ncbi:hypothetical protein EDC04DRAFT_2699080 [Pisolithus marmoratus]|nr:hypothetical protein EDC04DRAFT_2699080 [Pisolithus marmoratus]
MRALYYWPAGRAGGWCMTFLSQVAVLFGSRTAVSLILSLIVYLRCIKDRANVAPMMTSIRLDLILALLLSLFWLVARPHLI